MPPASPVMKITINRKWGVIIAVLVCVSILAVHQHRGKIYRHLYDVKKARLAELPAIAPRAEADTVIVNVNLVPMTSEVILPDHSVLVRRGRIVDVGQGLDFDPADGVRIIDGTGRYLTPGLADMHVHMDENVFSHRLFLINGVTSVREMSGSGKVLDWKRAVADDEIIGPDIYTTGPILRGQKSKSAGSSVVLRSAEEAVQEIQRQYRQGYRMVKPYTYLTGEVYQAIMQEAGKLGMSAVGHIPYSMGLNGVVAAGQYEVAHIHSFHSEFFMDFDETDVFREYGIDYAETDNVVTTARNAGMRVTTSLVVNQALSDAQDLDGFLARPMMEYEIGWAAPYISSPDYRLRTMWTAAYLDNHYLPWIYDLIRKLHDAGVPLVLGTDSGLPGLVHGFSTHDELELLVRSGLTPYQAWLTATHNAAVAVSAQDKWGTIEPGKQADFILLSKHPFLEVSHSTSIIGVMKKGRWFDHEALEKLHAEIKNAVD